MHSILLAILLGAAAGCQAPAGDAKQVAIPKATTAAQQPSRDAAAPSTPPTQAPKDSDKQSSGEQSSEQTKSGTSDCVFLHPESVDLTALVEPPPKPASAEHAKDEAILLWLQERRTPEDEARAWRSLSFDLTWFDEALGARLDPTWSSKLFETFRFVRNDLTRITQGLPESFKRDRPHANPLIKPCLPREDEITTAEGQVTLVNGYPSGPALRATVFAALLANLFEDRKDALMARAREVGYARTLGGVNYPSDVRAAEQLGAALARQIIAGDEWDKRVRELQAELAGLVQRRERSPKPTEPDSPAQANDEKPSATKVGEPANGSPK
jgi:acid phosphatase (class A)